MAQFSDSWTLELVEQGLQCSAGPDEVHLLTELEPETLAAIASWLCTGSVPEDCDLEGEAGETRNYLLAIGALDAPTPEGKIHWREVGDNNLVQTIADAVSSKSVRGPGLTIVVRSGGTLADLVESVRQISGPQILLDLAFHHTVGLGPFAIPGYTSCIGCYGQRISHTWGDPPPPLEPEVHRWLNVASELLDCQLRSIDEAASPLINATINWDLRTGRSTRDRLLRYVGCTVCGRGVRPGNGNLSWAPQAGVTA